MVCNPTPLSLTAGDLPSRCSTPNGALATPRSTWNRLAYPDPVSNQLAQPASQALVQSLADGDLLLEAPHDHVRYTP
jgi:hypothetical protein